MCLSSKKLTTPLHLALLHVHFALVICVVGHGSFARLARLGQTSPPTKAFRRRGRRFARHGATSKETLYAWRSPDMQRELEYTYVYTHFTFQTLLSPLLSCLPCSRWDRPLGLATSEIRKTSIPMVPIMPCCATFLTLCHLQKR